MMKRWQTNRESIRQTKTYICAVEQEASPRQHLGNISSREKTKVTVRWQSPSDVEDLYTLR